MTKYRDVNKCRRKEMQNGCPKSGKLTSGYEMANKPDIKNSKKEEEERAAWWKRRGKERKTKQHFLKRKRRQEMSASNETKAEYT